MRRLSVLSLAIAALAAACGGPAPHPTLTPFAPTPAAVFSPPFSSKPIQIAWFYKPPEDGNLATLTTYFDVFILTKRDEAERDALRAQGVTAPFLQYLRFDAIQDPGSCSADPRGNQAAYQPGDFCTIREQHPDWFLLDSHGQPIASGRDYLMDPGNAEWRAFWLERAQLAQEQLSWDGVFLDNVEASLSKRAQRGALPAKYPDDASYQAAVEGFLQHIYSSYFQPRHRPLFANIIALTDNSVWFRYLNYLDGAMEEAWAVDWSDGYKSEGWWEADLQRAEQTQGLGKRVILVAQGSRSDTQRELFAFASYLLVASGGASFRYSNDESYLQGWVYSNYRLDLGEPLGQRYYGGGLWRRDFAKGSVSVDPSSHAASIATK